jgi:hypothetical protein
MFVGGSPLLALLGVAARVLHRASAESHTRALASGKSYIMSDSNRESELCLLAVQMVASHSSFNPTRGSSLLTPRRVGQTTLQPCKLTLAEAIPVSDFGQRSCSGSAGTFHAPGATEAPCVLLYCQTIPRNSNHQSPVKGEQTLQQLSGACHHCLT